MSADSWTICPKCLQSRASDRDAAVEKVRAQYGSLSADEFVRQMNAASQTEEVPITETLREDYEIGMDQTGVFVADYSCECGACAFKWSFRHTLTVVRPES